MMSKRLWQKTVGDMGPPPVVEILDLFILKITFWMTSLAYRAS